MTAAFHYLFLVNPAAGKRFDPTLADKIRAAIENTGQPASL